ncbi:hypothetical protein FG05_13548 [Fusarium graminearum]|nr:hypothetical protein FG05_13548 [Fusarium graminearum]
MSRGSRKTPGDGRVSHLRTYAIEDPCSRGSALSPLFPPVLVGVGDSIRPAKPGLVGQSGRCAAARQSGRDRFNLVQSQSALHFTSNDRKDQQKKLNGSKLASAKLRYFGLGMSFLVPE